jgi:hypothetical protein
VKGTDHLPAELDDAAVRERRLLDAASGPVASLENHDVGAGLHQVARCAEAGQSRAHHDNVRFHGGILS